MRNKSKEILVNKDEGMSLAELSLSLMMLVAFLGVYSLSTKFINTFLKSSEILEGDSRSWVVNQHLIKLSMQKWSDILSQSAYQSTEIISYPCIYPNQSNLWGLPGMLDDNQLPKNYRYCIFQTSLGESDLDDLIYKNNSAKPGIYIIYALPHQITPSSMPIRHIFCRPRIYC